MKWIKSLSAIISAILVVVLLSYTYNSITGVSADDDNTIVDNVIFPHDEVIDVNIEIDEDTYSEMNANAMNEEYVMANITYNGHTFNNIAIRPKGNSSLQSVAKSDSNRYSFKIDFNYYVDDQSFYGITKINLNNLFSDPSMMSEYLGYEMLDYLDATCSRTNYVNLSINGEYFGLYLAVEQVNDQFLIENYGNASGELYKPEMGSGSDLGYISDDSSDYTALVPENKDEYDNEDIIELIKTIEEGGNLDEVFNVDSFLKYLAVSTMTIHQDSYQGGMFHNYYLYNNDGVFEWIPWDLNMLFNGFPASGMTDEDAIEYLIDEPVSGSMENYPLIEAIFENEEYVEKYHEYLETLCNGYLQQDNFNEKVLTIYKMINDYVENDPTSFYTYEEFENGLFQEEGSELGLLSFVEKRVENVEKQLSGELPSTNNGEGNNGSGSFGGGMKGQMPDDMQNQLLEELEGKTADEIIEFMTDNMGEQMPDEMKEIMIQQFEGKTADEIKELIINGMGGQMPEDMQGQVPDDMQGQVPDDMQGQRDMQGQMNKGMKGEMAGQNRQNSNLNTQEEQLTEENIKINSAEIILLCVLSALLIVSSIILHKKH